MSNRLALGVDVGGTKIAIALVDGKLGVSERIDVPSFATDGFELWGRIADATKEILSKADTEVVGIGIGSAGPIYPNPGTVSPVNIPVWREYHFTVMQWPLRMPNTKSAPASVHETCSESLFQLVLVAA